MSMSEKETRRMVDEITGANHVRIAVSWKDKPPLPETVNVYRIVGDVTFNNGKAVFKLERTGNTVEIDTDRLVRIFGVETPVNVPAETNT